MTDVLRTRTLPARTRRFLAGVTDVLVGLVAASLLIAVGAIDVSRWADLGPGLPLLESVAVELNQTRSQTIREWFLLWSPLLAYEVVLGALERETLGRWLFRVVLVGSDGHGLSRTRRVVRGVAVITWPLTALLAPALSWVSPTQRSLADYIAGAWVVNDPAREHRKSK